MSLNLKDKTIACYDIETPWITDKGIMAIEDIYCIGVVVVKNGEIVSKKVYTQYWTHYSDGSLYECIKDINKCDIRCAFNNVGFDDFVIRNVLNVDMPIMSCDIEVKSLDLLITSKLMLSKDELFSIDASLKIDKSLWGSHSLKAFGARLGDNKIHYEEFDEGLTEQLCIYCVQDCVVTAKLLLHLLDQPNFPSQEVLELEHKVAAIIQEQTNYGFYFDVDKARALNTKLLTEKHQIATELATMFSPKFLKDGQEKKYKGTTKSRKFLPDEHYQPLLGTKL